MRPALAWVKMLPRDWLNDADTLVLTYLALDSYGGTPAPGLDNLATWTKLHRGTVNDVLQRLSIPTERRPALLENTHHRRSKRTIWRLRYEILESGSAGLYVPSQSPAAPDSRARGTNGSESGATGLLEAPWSRSGVGTESGVTGLTPALTHLSSPPPTSPSAREEEAEPMQGQVVGVLMAQGIPREEAQWLWHELDSDPETRSPLSRIRTAWLDQARRKYTKRPRPGDSGPRCRICSKTRPNHDTAEQLVSAEKRHEFEDAS